MKRSILCLLLGVYILSSVDIFAQTAKISVKQIQLLTYPFSDPNPIPDFGKIYPYSRFEGYSAKGQMHNWNMVEMENDYIKLWITPEIGGKIWGAVEKATGKEFIYYNHVAKFRDVAMRGPWTSGGIEINFGVIGHAPTCSSPVDYYVRKNNDGSVSCFVGAIDLPSRTRWRVEINLPKDKAFFTTHSVWDNPTPLEQSYYHWMNLGVKTAGNLEYVFPGNYYLGHDGSHSSWPVNDQRRKINFYENNDFGSYKSYHVFGELTDFYGAYWHNDDFGFGHYAKYDEKPGKKIWIWGLSDQGMIWEKLLTDADGQYTELQSGRLFNQAAAESSLTPFKNREFSPGSTDEWTEFWFPVKETKGLKSALPAGSVNLLQNGSTCNLLFCPNEKTNGYMEVRSGRNVIYNKEIHADPMQVMADSFKYSGSYKSLSVWLNNILLFDADREKYQIKRPVETPVGFNWETAYGHYLKGKEQERQRLYVVAGEEYRKALDKEPYFIPALVGLAHIAYRQADFNESLKYSFRALSIDTYDPDANLLYGLSSLALGDTSSAIDGFSIASESVSCRTAAYNELASVFLEQGNYQKALDYANKSLIYNQLGTEAIQMKILCLRRLMMQEKAIVALNELEENDPLNHFIRFERFIYDPSDKNKTQIKVNITNDLPQETYLEYALWYYKNGQLSDALKILEIAPQDSPMVLLWEGYLNNLTGKEQLASINVEKALRISPNLVFPFRTESMKPLEWAKTFSADWKLNYYEGLIYINTGAVKKGLSLWMACGNNPDFFPFYISRSKLVDTTSAQAFTDMEKALTLAGDDWRAGLYASKFFMSQGNLNKAENLAADFYNKYPQNYYLALQLAKVLELNKDYSGCVKLLQKTQVLPNEGATEGRTIWRNANIGLALDLMGAHKYRKALENIEMAKQWPSNLGVGKPYSVDERLENFISLQCFKKLNDNLSVGKMQKSIIGEAEPQYLSSDINDFLTAWLLKESGKKSEGDEIMKGLVEKNSSSKIIQWCNVIYSGDLARAKTTATEVDRNDQIFLFLERIFGEL